MGYKYKNIYKDIFINGYKQLDVVENCKVFFNKIIELKPYIVEFDKNSVIKPKVYPLDWVIRGNNWRLITVITYDEYTFSANNRIQKTWD